MVGLTCPWSLLSPVRNTMRKYENAFISVSLWLQVNYLTPFSQQQWPHCSMLSMLCTERVAVCLQSKNSISAESYRHSLSQHKKNGMKPTAQTYLFTFHPSERAASVCIPLHIVYTPYVDITVSVWQRWKNKKIIKKNKSIFFLKKKRWLYRSNKLTGFTSYAKSTYFRSGETAYFATLKLIWWK